MTIHAQLRTGLMLALVILFLGAKGSCVGVVKPEDLCGETGGTWDTSECPRSCWPPACGQSPDQMCTAVCGREPVCRCPSEKPFWVDGQGCWSQAECSKKCVGEATSCFMTMIGCRWQDGCHEDCDTDSHGHEDCDCHGFATECSEFTNPTSCGNQDGCRWE